MNERSHDKAYIKIASAVLRPWRRDDAKSLAKYADNPKIAQVMRDSFPSPYTYEDAERFIKTATGPGSALLLAIEAEGEACGGIGIIPLRDVYKKTAEIGYWLAEPFWGRGIVTDAVCAIVPVAIERFDIVRIQAVIFETNHASARVLEKCGFEREAVHRKAVFKNGEIMDEIMYARVKEE